MKIPCNTIRDLLPLYYDEVCSLESRKLIESHIEECQECKSELDKYDMDVDSLSNVTDAKPLKNISEKWKAGKRVSFFKGSLVVSIIACIFSASMYKLNGSYVDENGYLIESFGFIPLAYLFGFIALLSGLMLIYSKVMMKYKSR